MSWACAMLAPHRPVEEIVRWQSVDAWMADRGVNFVDAMLAAALVDLVGPRGTPERGRRVVQAFSEPAIRAVEMLLYDKKVTRAFRNLWRSLLSARRE